MFAIETLSWLKANRAVGSKVTQSVEKKKRIFLKDDMHVWSNQLKKKRIYKLSRIFHYFVVIYEIGWSTWVERKKRISRPLLYNYSLVIWASHLTLIVSQSLLFSYAFVRL